jgi:hypothetical protein
VKGSVVSLAVAARFFHPDVRRDITLGKAGLENGVGESGRFRGRRLGR